MTPENKMPDELHLEDGMICEELHAICVDHFCYADNRPEKMQEIVRRYNEHQSLVTERDTLKALCEQMAGALEQIRPLSKYDHKAYSPEIRPVICTNEANVIREIVRETLTAYQKYKGGA